MQRRDPYKEKQKEREERAGKGGRDWNDFFTAPYQSPCK